MRILSPFVRPKRVHREECIVPNVSVTSHDAPVVSLQLTAPACRSYFGSKPHSNPLRHQHRFSMAEVLPIKPPVPSRGQLNIGTLNLGGYRPSQDLIPALSLPASPEAETTIQSTMAYVRTSSSKRRRTTSNFARSDGPPAAREGPPPSGPPPESYRMQDVHLVTMNGDLITTFKREELENVWTYFL